MWAQPTARQCSTWTGPVRPYRIALALRFVGDPEQEQGGDDGAHGREPERDRPQSPGVRARAGRAARRRPPRRGRARARGTTPPGRRGRARRRSAPRRRPRAGPGARGWTRRPHERVRAGALRAQAVVMELDRAACLDDARYLAPGGQAAARPAAAWMPGVEAAVAAARRRRVPGLARGVEPLAARRPRDAALRPGEPLAPALAGDGPRPHAVHHAGDERRGGCPVRPRARRAAAAGGAERARGAAPPSDRLGRGGDVCRLSDDAQRGTVEAHVPHAPPEGLRAQAKPIAIGLTLHPQPLGAHLALARSIQLTGLSLEPRHKSVVGPWSLAKSLCSNSMNCRISGLPNFRIENQSLRALQFVNS